MKRIIVFCAMMSLATGQVNTVFAEESAESRSYEAKITSLSQEAFELRQNVKKLVADQGLSVIEAQAHRLHLRIEKLCSTTESSKTSNTRDHCNRAWRDFRAANRYLRKLN